MSPADKNLPGATFSDSAKGVRVLPTGDGVLSWANPPLPGAEQALFNDYRSARGASGWGTMALLPRLDEDSPQGGQDSFVSSLGTTDDGSRVLYETQVNLDPADTDEDSSGSKGVDLYLRQPDGSFAFVTGGELNLSTTTGDLISRNQVRLVDDGHRVVFAARLPLLTADAARTGAYGLYEWHDGQLTLVASDPSGAAMTTDLVVLGNGDIAGPNPVSRDGSRIFFTVGSQHVFVRDHGVVKSIAPGGSPSGSELFQGATPDGSHAFFITTEALTPDDTDTGADLYRYDVADGTLTRISKGEPGQVADVSNDGVRVSDDGSVVYFQAPGQLGSAPAPDPGRTNVYVATGDEVRYVGSVGDSELNIGPTCGPWDGWEASADGSYLVMATAVPMTADDTDGNVDLYQYGLASGDLRRVTQGPAGGNAPVDAPGGIAFLDCDPGSSTAVPRVMSEDGRYVAFATDEALVDRDNNGVRDVYRYDRVSDTTDLVSGGTGTKPSPYLGMGRTGRDIFFATYDQLAPQDGDRLKDIYDARIGGGFPVEEPVRECEDDACQGDAHGGVPSLTPPGSSTLLAPQFLPVEKAATLGVAALSHAQRRSLARRGQTRLSIRASKSGTLTIVGKATIGKRSATVVERVAKARANRTVGVTVRLSKRARAQLERKHTLTIRLTVALGSAEATKRLTVRLSLPRAHTSSSTQR